MGRNYQTVASLLRSCPGDQQREKSKDKEEPEHHSKKTFHFRNETQSLSKEGGKREEDKSMGAFAKTAKKGKPATFYLAERDKQTQVNYYFTPLKNTKNLLKYSQCQMKLSSSSEDS